VTDADKETSYRVLRRRLYLGWGRHHQGLLISRIDADQDELRRALEAIPDIRNVEVMWRMVGNDGVWAARDVLGEGQ
jgi:vacuolar-type H+-ATPase subunit C/Vma6